LRRQLREEKLRKKLKQRKKKKNSRRKKKLIRRKKILRKLQSRLLMLGRSKACPIEMLGPSLMQPVNFLI